jgi:hypothetical protein
MTISPTPHRRSATRRPLAITILGWLFVLVGVAGLVSSALSLWNDVARPSGGGPAHRGEPGLVLAVRALAVVGGALVLYGVSSARWLLVAWMAWHVVLSLGHTSGELAVHAVFLVLLLFVLFSRQATAYFGTARLHNGSTR